MNLNEYIIKVTNRSDIYYYDESDTMHNIIVLDLKKWNWKDDHYNKAINKLIDPSALFLIGGLPLLYSLVKDRVPVLINQLEPSLSVVLPFDKDSCKINVGKIPKMLQHHYWEYLNLWNIQGNRNIICESRFFEHILYNRFNPVRFL